MSGKPGRSGGRRVSHRKKPELVFVGTPTAPSACPRERCGQPVSVHTPGDPKAPVTWSCVVGHGGVVAVKAPEIRQDPTKIPREICQRCATNPVPPKRRRGGFRGGYCDDCIEEGRRLFANGRVHA